MKLSRVSFLFGVGLLSLTLGACTSPNAGDEWKMENQDRKKKTKKKDKITKKNQEKKK
jgi:hypothetical protein